MKSLFHIVCPALLFFAFSARASAAPPATETDFPPFPGSVLLSDEKNQFSPAMTRLNRTFSTEASGDEVFEFYRTRLATPAQKPYAMAATLKPGETSGVAAMTGAVYGKSFLSTAPEEIKRAFSKRRKAAGTDWVQGASFLWSSKDAGGVARSFSLDIRDQSITDDDPPRYEQKTQITLNVTITAATAAGTGSIAGLKQLGQKSQDQMDATQKAVDETFARDLFEPAKSGTPQQVLAALKAGGKIEERNLGGVTPLMTAAANNPDPQVISVLLKAAAAVNGVSSTSFTPLMYAAMGNTAAVVTALIRAGADVKAQTVPGATPLWMAAGNAHPGVITALVKAGADVHLRLASLAQTPLLLAVESSNPVAVLELLDKGAGTDLKGADGVRSLASAVTKRPKLDIIAALIKGGADVNGKDSDTGSTALMRAANAGVDDVRVYRMLLDSGARVNDSNTYGKTALMFASESCHNREVLSILLTAGADPAAKDAFGNTAAFYAQQNQNLQGAGAQDLDTPGANMR